MSHVCRVAPVGSEHWWWSQAAVKRIHGVGNCDDEETLQILDESERSEADVIRENRDVFAAFSYCAYCGPMWRAATWANFFDKKKRESAIDFALSSALRWRSMVWRRNCFALGMMKDPMNSLGWKHRVMDMVAWCRVDT